MGIKQAFVYLFLIIPLLSFGRPPLTDGEIKNKIRAQQKKLSKIEKKLRGLEKRLFSKNSNFLKGQKKLRSLESTLFILNREIGAEKDHLSEEMKKAKKVLSLYVANSFSPENSKVMLRKKVLMNLLAKRMGGFKKTKLLLERQLKTVKELDEKIEEIGRSQQDLVSVLRELEKEKSKFANSYLLGINDKNSLISKRSFLKHRPRNKRLVKFTFGSPLKEYNGVEYKGKGVTFKFRGQKAVVATRDGEIAYVGSLSSYGNVVMIDHGKDTRSILLGGFLPKLTKGTRVKKGGLIGYTKGKRLEGKIYFEVRKKNKAQNTFVLMDKEFVSRNNIDQKKPI